MRGSLPYSQVRPSKPVHSASWLGGALGQGNVPPEPDDVELPAPPVPCSATTLLPQPALKMKRKGSVSKPGRMPDYSPSQGPGSMAEPAFRSSKYNMPRPPSLLKTPTLPPAAIVAPTTASVAPR